MPQATHTAVAVRRPSSALSHGVKSTALMRRAYHDAMTVAKGPVVFGRRIIDLPLARRQLMKIMLATEQALSRVS